MLSGIVCVQNNGGIGFKGELLWKFDEDMRWFSRITKQIGAVVMGRKTYESIGHPLPDRENYVLSSTPIEAKGVHWVKSLDEIIRLSEKKDIVVIGGASLPSSRSLHLYPLYYPGNGGEVR